jgi:hypothetical protein
MAQRALALQRRLAQPLEVLVIAPRFEVFVVEVLHRLVVQQRVDRPRVRGAVQLVHLLAELRAPLRHRDGESDVQHQRRQRDPGKGRVELRAQQREHQHHLHERGEDAVQRVADQRVHRASAAFDVACHAAGLALEVEAQAQGVQVAKDLQADAARRAFGGPGEDQLAQFGEQRSGQPQRAVGDQQAHRHHEQRGGVTGLDRQGIDQVLQQHRHADVGHLGTEQKRQRDAHPPAVAPQVRQQLGQRGPVATRGPRGRQGGRGRGWRCAHLVGRTHERLSWVFFNTISQ